MHQRPGIHGTDYRKIPRPSRHVYFSPLNKDSEAHADNWFEYFGGQPLSNARPSELELWGRKYVPTSLSPLCPPTPSLSLCLLVQHIYPPVTFPPYPSTVYRTRHLIHSGRLILDLRCRLPWDRVQNSHSTIYAVFPSEAPIISNCVDDMVLLS